MTSRSRSAAILKVKLIQKCYISFIIAHREAKCSIIIRKSWSQSPLVPLVLTYDLSFKVISEFKGKCLGENGGRGSQLLSTERPLVVYTVCVNYIPYQSCKLLSKPQNKIKLVGKSVESTQKPITSLFWALQILAQFCQRVKHMRDGLTMMTFDGVGCPLINQYYHIFAQSFSWDIVLVWRDC